MTEQATVAGASPSRSDARMLTVIQPSPANASLPALANRWVIGALAGASIPPETVATCASCIMVTEGNGGADGAGRTYSAETKCCTYVPTFANFQVGAILADTDPALAFGRRTLEERLDGRAGVTPLGVAAPSVYRAIYRLSSQVTFGRSKALLCPHYDNGGLWSMEPPRGGMYDLLLPA